MAAATRRRGGRRQENLALISRIAELLHEYTDEEVSLLVESHLANAKPVKRRPRGRTARKKDGTE